MANSLVTTDVDVLKLRYETVVKFIEQDGNNMFSTSGGQSHLAPDYVQALSEDDQALLAQYVLEHFGAQAFADLLEQMKLRVQNEISRRSVTEGWKEGDGPEEKIPSIQ